ncbi:conserved hypothetical protein [Pediculus humanus corporis]|uniref:T-cell activation inhibitor, mitochondrial n=1 Tax=Pediculus humanus subsp. corporis TaxID=121224 RepID=E0VTQ9_PEDHC|nr:uncharacterized protein Phum_PHUM436440 [Pediculus humanus corporis]EEB16765.1 conserved hypothetical protein [Pediculus humanus corporis]
MKVHQIMKFDGCSSLPLLNPLCRSLSSTEVSTALRPFYFFVHPDLFGQFPEERAINENSLKLLSSYLETLILNLLEGDWLSKNYSTAQEQLKAHEPLRDEIKKLKYRLCNELDLKKIKWDCGWNISHFKGSLQSLLILYEHHPQELKSLSGKTLIFGNETGVNLDGDVMLNCGEVRNNWLDVIKNIHRQDKVILKLPQFEKAVSRVLRDIKVVHRKFQPKVTAEKYENQLRRLITSLSDYQGRNGYPKHWPEKLNKFELVVETEAGPLMVSPTGQIIVPSSCPASILVNFISENLEEANRLLDEYKSNKYVEKDIHSRVVLEFRLLSLRKDDNITPKLMIDCCNNMLKHKNILKPLLNNSSLFITSYFSLLSDGQMCIPWNWKI